MGIENYYALRAREFDAVYEKPERQRDLAALKVLIADLLAGHDVLELACGTGYWTEVIAPSARSVLATDINPEMLSEAHRRLGTSVRLAVADAWKPESIGGHFTAALAAFWWSHIRKRELPLFLEGLRDRLGMGERLVFVDNRYVEGSSTPIADTDEFGDSYQIRILSDGSTHRVVKNFPEPDEIRGALARVGVDAELRRFDHYWCAWCTTACGT